MSGIGTTLSMIGILGTALLAPMLYLLLAGNSDPEGIVDGLIRLTWFMPALWIGGVYLEVKGRPGRFRGVIQLYTPMLIALALTSFFFFGWRNRSREIVLEPAADSRAQTHRRSRGEEVYAQGTITGLGGLGRWAHETLPPHPLPKNRD